MTSWENGDYDKKECENDKHGQRFTNIVVKQVKVKFESEEYQMVRDTLILLFYYFIFLTAIFEEKKYNKVSDGT